MDSINPVSSLVRGGVLSPVERISEVLFGLIMVLTFTGSLSIAEAGREDVRVMLIGALGCNLAWAIIDAGFYLLGCLAEKGGNVAILQRLRAAGSPAEAREVLEEALPAPVAAVLEPDDFEGLRRRLEGIPLPARPRLDWTAWRGAFGVFLLVFLSTFPVVLPFVFVAEVWTAMRWSNAIAVTMLFVAGFCYGRAAGRGPWWTGLGMVVLGLLLVSLTIALGG